MAMTTSSLFIITGPRGTGKTTFCYHLVELARDAGWQIAGILSLPIFENKQKIAINVQDLRTGRQRRLAIRREVGQPATGPHTPGWHFDPAALAWGNTVLQTACPCDLLIVDELGLLEFERDEGWQAGLSAIDSDNYRWGLVVIRPELLAVSQRRWPIAKVIPITKNVDLHPMANRLAQQLWLD
jgi:nucleoside-triphosphatase THEP1